MKFVIGTILLLTISAGVAQAVPRTATYQYDSQGRLIQANYVNGNITTAVSQAS